MGPTPVLFAPLFLLPGKVPWEVIDVYVAPSAEASSDEGTDRAVPDKVESVDAPECGTSSMSAPVPVVVTQVNVVSSKASAVAPTANAVPITAAVATTHITNVSAASFAVLSTAVPTVIWRSNSRSGTLAVAASVHAVVRTSAACCSCATCSRCVRVSRSHHHHCGGWHVVG